MVLKQRPQQRQQRQHFIPYIGTVWSNCDHTIFSRTQNISDSDSDFTAEADFHKYFSISTYDTQLITQLISSCWYFF